MAKEIDFILLKYQKLCHKNTQHNYLPAFICGTQQKVVYGYRRHGWCPTIRDEEQGYLQIDFRENL